MQLLFSEWAVTASRLWSSVDTCAWRIPTLRVISIHATRTNCRNPSIFRSSNASTKLKPGYSKANVFSPTQLSHYSVLFACLMDVVLSFVAGLTSYPQSLVQRIAYCLAARCFELLSWRALLAAKFLEPVVNHVDR